MTASTQHMAIKKRLFVVLLGIFVVVVVRAKEKGYAFEDQELRKGVRRIAAPIYDHKNHLAGCVGIAATIFSFEIDDKENLGRQVIETAGRISYGMGKPT